MVWNACLGLDGPPVSHLTDTPQDRVAPTTSHAEISKRPEQPDNSAMSKK